MQAMLRLGIFDIDDVILNALGVMTGYWIFQLLAKWIRARNYKNIVIAVAVAIITIAAAIYALYPKGQVVNPEDRAASQSGNLCGNTRGTGQIVRIDSHTFTIKRNDDVLQTIDLTSQTTFRTSAGQASKADLQIGDRVTVVVEDSETASTVLVCGT